jgi:hypothetical protein
MEPTTPPRRLTDFLHADLLNRLWRTVGQGLLVTAVVAGWEAARQAFVPGEPFDWRKVGLTGLSAAGVVVSTYVVSAIRTGRIEPLPLTLDGLVRSGRTVLSGALATAGAAGVEAARAGLTAGEGFELSHVGYTALTGAGVALLAYFHRTKLDPASVPSAVPPPAPPAVLDWNDPPTRSDDDPPI